MIFILSCIISFCAAGQKHTFINDGFLKSSKIDSTKVLKEIRLSRDAYKQNPESGEEYDHANNAIDLALALNDTLLYARALDNLGLIYRFHQQYAQAISLHTKAFELIKHLETAPIYKMIFANNVGVAARYFEKYDIAVLYYLAALRIADKEK